MGCPAKKVCKKLVGSALMRDEHLIGEILDAVVSAVPVPVTLKMRTGWEPGQRNAVRIARLAESAGIQAITIHGRTRQCKYRGPVEYDTIRAVKHEVTLPVIANGDIDSPQKAQAVLAYTGADAVMIGRAAQGNPWLFGRIDRYLREGWDPGEPLASEKRLTLIQHLEHLYRFYGARNGVRIARKHFSWYVSAQGGDERSRRLFCAAADPVPQLRIARSIQFAPRHRDVKSDEKMAQTAVSIG
jgi:tRNA-dihydrouridine synthase B